MTEFLAAAVRQLRAQSQLAKAAVGVETVQQQHLAPPSVDAATGTRGKAEDVCASESEIGART